MNLIQNVIYLWNSDDPSSEALEQLVGLMEKGVGEYFLPIVLCCMGTTGIIFWQLQWYKLLIIYLSCSVMMMAIVGFLFWFVKIGVKDIRDSEKATKRLIDRLNAALEKRRAAAAGGEEPDAATQLGKCL